tara:strand:+ start:582 stop:938 length:357 start_codon:yes stop_codon:yes gene_type:complete
MSAQNRQNYLYFAEDPVETTNEAMLLPVSSYRGCDPGDGTTGFFFESVDGTATREVITLTHTAGKNKQVINAMIEIMNGAHKNNDGFTVVADSELIGTTKAAVFHKAFKGIVTACAIA